MGLRRLDKALAAMPGVEAEKEWCAFTGAWSLTPMLAAPFFSPAGQRCVRPVHAGTAFTSLEHPPCRALSMLPRRHAYLLDWNAPSAGERTQQQLPQLEEQQQHASHCWLR